jgi:Caspase domain
MPRAVSIHIGVNEPRDHHVLLRHCENGAWGMAGLASRAGYDSILMLRGPAATRAAVHGALAGAAGTLARGDTLLVSFSGHGGQETDRDLDERHGSDESWCLYDGNLLDDKLAGYWRLFDPGIRIVVVSESCYSGGMDRPYDEALAALAAAQATPKVMRGGGAMRSPASGPVAAAAAGTVASCIAEPPRDAYEIRASVLMLTA